MTVSENFIYSKKIKSRKLTKYVKRINRGLNVKGLIVVVVNQESKDLMEVLSLREFYRSLERGRDKTIIGLAKTREEAFECVGTIIQNIVSQDQMITKTRLNKEFRI